MADDPIRTYLESRAAFDKARAGAETGVNTVKAIAKALDHWDNLMFSNVNVGFPMEIAMGRVPSINASEWPSVERLAQAVADYHSARSVMRNAWHRVPTDMQSGLQPPPTR